MAGRHIQKEQAGTRGMRMDHPHCVMQQQQVNNGKFWGGLQQELGWGGVAGTQHEPDCLCRMYRKEVPSL